MEYNQGLLVFEKRTERKENLISYKLQVFGSKWKKGEKETKKKKKNANIAGISSPLREVSKERAHQTGTNRERMDCVLYVKI